MQDHFGNENRPAGSFDPATGRDYGPGDPDVFIRKRRWAHGPQPRLFGAIFLIAAGAFLFLDDIGVLRVHNIWDYWPLILIGIGFSKLLACRRPSEKSWGVLLVAFGALFLLLNLHVFRIVSWNQSWPFPLLLIALGLVALVKSIESNVNARPRVGFPRHATKPSREFSNDVLDESTVAGNVKRRIDSANFAGGDINCFFGSVEIDLRYAQIPAKDKLARIDINCFCGAAKIRVPDNWVVSIQAPAVLGNVEDKTIPPRTVAGVEPSTLIITGQCVLGSIDLEN